MLFHSITDSETLPTSTTAPTAFPSPGRWEGDGRGDRGEVSGGGGRQPCPPPLLLATIPSFGQSICPPPFLPQEPYVSRARFLQAEPRQRARVPVRARSGGYRPAGRLHVDHQLPHLREDRRPVAHAGTAPHGFPPGLGSRRGEARDQGIPPHPPGGPRRRRRRRGRLGRSAGVGPRLPGRGGRYPRRRGVRVHVLGGEPREAGQL